MSKGWKRVLSFALSITMAASTIVLGGTSSFAKDEIPADGYSQVQDSNEVPADYVDTSNDELEEIMEEVSSELSVMSVDTSKKVEIAFVIDSTGSMYDEITNVKNNITKFSQYIENKGVTLRISVIDYRDITCDGKNSTIVHTLNYSPWHTSTSDMVKTLGDIYVNGGGDSDETTLDGLGILLNESSDVEKSIKWSSDAYKFAIVLTDAGYKINNNYGYTSMNQVIDELIAADINTSVITSSYYKSEYEDLYTKTGGIYADINSSDFWKELQLLADNVLSVTLKNTKAIYMLPDLGGSKLYDESGNIVWDNDDTILSGANLDGALAIPYDAETGTGDKYGAGDEYQLLMDSMEKNCTTEYDVFFYPYNWTEDLDEITKKLEADIAESGYEQVIFVTHGAGGLIASAYIGKSRENKLKVEKNALIAPPLYGTYDALTAIETGSNADLEKYALSFNAPTVKSWIKNRTSASTYQILPSSEYLINIPIIYNNDAIVSIDEYYNVLNKSANIDPAMTTGDPGSHKSFRNNSIGSIVDLWSSPISETIKEVDYTILASSYNEKPVKASVVYEDTADGTKLAEVIENLNGDGVVNTISSFAYMNNAPALKVKDFPGKAHDDFVKDSDSIKYIIDYIDAAEAGITEDDSSTVVPKDMTDRIRILYQADKDVVVDIYNASDELIGTIPEDEYALDNKQFSFYDFKLDSDLTDAQLTVPYSGYKLAFRHGTEAGVAVDFNSEIANLSSDGYRTNTATVKKNITKENGILYWLDMTDEPLDDVTKIEDKETVSENIDWSTDKEIIINKGETVKPEITVIPEDKKAELEEKLILKSSDESIVTVDNDTKELTATEAGKALVTITDGNKTIVIIVTVPQPVENMVIDDFELRLNEKKVISPIFIPADTTERNVTYTVQDPSIVDITDGIATGLAVGSTDVVAENGSVTVKFTITVTYDGIVAVKSIALDKSEIKINPGNSEVLEAIITPSNADNKKVQWFIDDESIASIIDNENGTCIIEAEKLGTTKITAVTVDGGYTASCTLIVTDEILSTPTPTPTAEPTATPTIPPTDKPSPTPTPIPPSSGANDGITWNIDGDTLILNGNCNMPDYSECGAPWYWGGYYKVKHIIINEHITSVGANAFYGFSLVEDISLNGLITSIGNGAMNGCSSLKSIDIPEKVTGIGANAFKDCTSLTNVTVGENVTNISQGAFEGCSSLESITLPFIGAARYSVDTVTVFDYIFGGSVPESLKTVIITDDTGIPEGAFEDDQYIENITVNDEVAVMNKNSFKNCKSLKSYVINSNITVIPDSAFEGCTFLETIEIPDTVQNIGKQAFKDCKSLKSIHIPSGVSTIYDETFMNCKSIKEIEIPDTVTSIGKSVLSGAIALESVKIPFIGDSKNIVNTTELDENKTFGYLFGTTNDSIPTSVTKVVVTNAITNTDADKFAGVPPYAFASCANVIDIIIERGASVYRGAFENCRALKSLYLPRTVSTISENILFGSTSLETLSVPFIGQSRRLNGKETSVLGYFFGWNDGNHSATDISQIYNEDGSSHFYRIPASLKNVIVIAQTTLPYGAFSNTMVENVSIISGATIDTAAFYNCQYLKNVKLPNDMQIIGEEAFAECYSLESINIPAQTTSIGANAFYNDRSLKNITIPDSVTTISSGVFGGIGSSDDEIFTMSDEPLTIICTEGSYAQTYAKAMNINFEIKSKSEVEATSPMTFMNTLSDGTVIFDVTAYEAGKVYAALYSDKNELISVKTADKSLGADVKFTYESEDLVNADSIKFMIWNGMTPSTNVEEKSITQ